jgi:hypothetical protein
VLYLFLKYWYAFLGAAVFALGVVVIWLFPMPVFLGISTTVSTAAIFALYAFRHRHGPWFRMPGTASWGMVPILLFGFLLLEHRAERMVFALVGSVLVGAFLCAPLELLPTNPNQRAWRRLYTVLVTLCAFWGVSILSAVDIFFPAVWMGVLAILCALGMGLLTFVGLAIHYPLHTELRRASAVYACISGELFVALALLPWSPFSRGVLFTWLWYMCLRLTRFAFSEEGIRWKEQRLIIASNVVLGCVYMLSLRFV